jgi:hypothetical protein
MKPLEKSVQKRSVECFGAFLNSIALASPPSPQPALQPEASFVETRHEHGVSRTSKTDPRPFRYNDQPRFDEKKDRAEARSF